MKIRQPEFEELQCDFRKFGGFVRAAAEKPDSFWANQRERIKTKIQGVGRIWRWRGAILWAPAGIMAVLCVLFFTQSSKAPSPDFAAGYDQRLLIEVERALNRDCPEVLVPAELITQEIEHGLEHRGPPPPSKTR